MAGLADLETRVAQLEQAAERIRELVREAHAATKDLRSAIRDANEVLSSGPVMERIDREVALGLERYTNEIKRAQAAAVEKVGDTFEELAAIYTGEDRRHGPTLLELADRKREAREAGTT